MPFSAADDILAALPVRQREWLELVLSDWQLVADLAFADLLLWAPDHDSNSQETVRLVPIAQARPSTTQSLFQGEPSREDFDRTVLNLISSSWHNQKSHRTFQRVEPGSGIQVEAVPIMHEGQPMGVMTMHLDLAGNRLPSKLEMIYRQTATDLMLMAAQGLWPSEQPHASDTRMQPRVGDGLVRLNVAGEIDYASPNGVSAFRRIGQDDGVVGRKLSDIFSGLRGGGLPSVGLESHVLAGTISDRIEIEHRGVTLMVRSLPLWNENKRLGAIVLVRDISELRRRELQLVSKDATIREIHHRVKNNLQTVAALLRMQSRRMNSEEARKGLEEAMRRVETIAQVHHSLSQGLSQTVDFDELMTRQFRMAVEVATQNQKVRALKAGTFGHLDSEKATPLALVITELAANAVEHGLGKNDGTVKLTAKHSTTEDGRVLEVMVSDDGCGLPEDFETDTGLGLQIVRTLVKSELQGKISWQNREGGGTKVLVTVPVKSRPASA
ncbi:sensor histidine kinase [Micrococcoides hystricis]|uniref:histidine kinase n=1 Tax=Micrococcoides hystricis TaxID=1572761 RepID=A0ABV6P863_9MICC